MTKRNFGTLVDNAVENINQRKQERANSNELRKQIDELNEQLQEKDRMLEEQKDILSEMKGDNIYDSNQQDENQERQHTEVSSTPGQLPVSEGETDKAEEAGNAVEHTDTTHSDDTGSLNTDASENLEDEKSQSDESIEVPVDESESQRGRGEDKPISKQSESKKKKAKSKEKKDDQGKEKVATIKRTFYMRDDLYFAFNIAVAKRRQEKGALLNEIIEEWLKKNGEI